jgi:peptide-methionine (S)-S-oxide reductase
MNPQPVPQLATLAGGCFWCLEAVFEKVRGVSKIVSGYTGGTVADPSYRQVCTGGTGHAEVVQITFDPAQVSVRDLLQIFFVIHDPTTPNRQGADVGTQYRSAIFYHDDEQEKTALEVIAEFSAAGVFRSPIVTEVVPLEKFYPAEDYHQGYYRNNSDQGYCVAVIEPKLAKLRKKFLEQLSES